MSFFLGLSSVLFLYKAKNCALKDTPLKMVMQNNIVFASTQDAKVPDMVVYGNRY